MSSPIASGAGISCLDATQTRHPAAKGEGLQPAVKLSPETSVWHQKDRGGTKLITGIEDMIRSFARPSVQPNHGVVLHRCK